MSLNVCIFGVSGYTGSKLLYYLNKHKKITVVGVFGNSNSLSEESFEKHLLEYPQYTKPQKWEK